MEVSYVELMVSHSRLRRTRGGMPRQAGRRDGADGRPAGATLSAAESRSVRVFRRLILRWNALNAAATVGAFLELNKGVCIGLQAHTNSTFRREVHTY